MTPLDQSRLFFFFNDTATTEIYTLSLHDALPIFDPLPAVTSSVAAVAPGAPQIHPDIPGNVVLDYHYGDAEAVAAAFARASHVTRLELVSNRVVVNAMEPRSAIGRYDRADQRWTLHVGCQGVFGLRNTLAHDILAVAPEQVHVSTDKFAA